MQKKEKIKIDAQVILASSSQTRITMVKKFFNNIRIEKHNVDEQLEKNNKRDLKPEELAKHLAMKKAQSISNIFNDKYIIGCDQILECEGKLLNKPKDLDEAKANLLLLSGKKHKLFTCLYVLKKTKEFFVEETISHLYFKKITIQAIDKYISENIKTALSCVGSYKIEDNDKYNFLEIIEGNKEAIVGFPIKNLIKKFQSNKL